MYIYKFFFKDEGLVCFANFLADCGRFDDKRFRSGVEGGWRRFGSLGQQLPFRWLVIGKQPSLGEQCGGICIANPSCTHFIHVDGTCWIKRNPSGFREIVRDLLAASFPVVALRAWETTKKKRNNRTKNKILHNDWIYNGVIKGFAPDVIHLKIILLQLAA